MRCSTRLPLLLLPLCFTPRVWAQAIGESPVLNVNGAQDPGPQGRYNFPDEQIGIRGGPFLLFPSAAVAAAYDSNVLATPAAQRVESELSVAQALLHVTNEPGGVLSLDGQGYARGRRFSADSNQNTNEYGGNVTLGGQLSARDQLTANVMAQHLFESRTDVETPDIPQVSVYDEMFGNLAYVHSYNRLEMHYTVQGQQLEYRDASQKVRDRTSYQGVVTGIYGDPGGLQWVGSGFYSNDNYRFDSPLVASAHTVGALFGVQADYPQIAQFRLSAGYFQRNLDNGLGEISGLSIQGSMLWYLTRLTTVRAELTRQDEPTRIPGAYGKVQTDGSIELGHAYSWNLNLFARARVVVDDFQTLHRTDHTYLGDAGAYYQLSRGWVISAQYDMATRSSDVGPANFLQHVISVSLLGRF